MKNRVIAAISALLVVGILTVSLSLKWVDSQEIPVSIDARTTLHQISSIYPFLPGKCDDKCISRTIKIADLVALSALGKKSLSELSEDLSIGFSLLNTTLNKGDFPDRTAEYELALERLLFFNRMNALAISLGSRMEGKGYLEKALTLQGSAYDAESKAVLRRETILFHALQNKDSTGVFNQEYSSDLSISDAYQLMESGLVACAINDERGIEYLQRAKAFFADKRAILVHAVGRNIDVPLFVLAEQHMACKYDIDALKSLMKN